MNDFSPQAVQMTWLVLVIMLPLVPAWITYRLSPNSPISSKGSLGGLSLSAGGSFAAYIVLFALIFTVVKDKINPQDNILNVPEQKLSWKVQAQIITLDYEGLLIDEDIEFRNLEVTMEPRQYNAANREVTIYVPGNSRHEWPKSLVLSLPQNYTGRIDLDDEDSYRIDEKLGIIHYESVVTMRQKREARSTSPQYSESGNLQYSESGNLNQSRSPTTN